MKKRWCAFLAALMAAALLTGCAGNGQQTSEASQSTGKVSESSKSDTSSVQASADSEQGDEESGEEIVIDPEDSDSGITIDHETGELVIDPDVFGDNVSITEVSADDSNPFAEIAYNAFRISGEALGDQTLPSYYFMTSPQEVETFLNSNQETYSLTTAMVGNEDNQIPFLEYANNYNDDFFAGQDLMMLFVCCSAAGDKDLGDVLVDEAGNVSVEIWGEAPKSDSDKDYWCYAIAYRKGAMNSKKVSVKFADLAEGEGEE